MVTELELQDLMTTGLKTYFHDSFLSTEMVDTSLTQTAAVYKHVGQVLIASGVQEGSEARANYDVPIFNPRYGTLRIKLRLNSMKGCTVFVGFKGTLLAPTWGMTETCSGLFIDYANDAARLYFYTGSGSAGAPASQVTPIVDIDMTRWLVFEISHNNMRYYSVPYTVPYFDKNVLPGIKQGMTRKWSKNYQNGSVLPADEMQYIVAYIKNHTGNNQTLDMQHITYSEVYPD